MYTLNCKGKLLVIEKPLVMGIVNATPDSFYNQRLYNGTEAIIALADKMISDGADMLDIGGQSTRPGSKRISAEEEMERVLPVIHIYCGGKVTISKFQVCTQVPLYTAFPA